MNNNPKVSVIMPTYNMAHMIGRAIKSVQDQTFQDFEIVVVNDGSTDNTQEFIKDLSSKDPRIRFIDNIHSGKPAVATNTGIREAKGDYIAILDSDDEWLPAKLEKQVKLMESNPKLGFVACNTVLMYSDGTTKEQPLPHTSSLIDSLLIKCYLYPSSMLAKREVMHSIGLIDEKYWIFCDWGMFTELAKKYEYNFVDEVLYKYYIHNTNHSYQKNYTQQTHDREYYIMNNIDLYRERPKLLEYQYIRLASDLISLGEPKKARDYLKKCLELSPSINNIARLTISYFGKSAYHTYRKLRGRAI